MTNHSAILYMAFQKQKSDFNLYPLLTFL